MFLLPWRVDVPQDRRPWVNWLILVALVAVFAMQIVEHVEREQAAQTYTGQSTSEELPEAAPSPTGLNTLVLRGWSLKGLFGHMWLHAGLFHLLGNMWFLWIFGNAVCAKVGNLRYLLLYISFGVAGGIAHLLTSTAGAIGASGAIFGIVGMYTVLFFENSITCYFIAWFVIPIVRAFSVSSIWMILFWVASNVIGAFRSGSGVAHTAHLGGYAAGFGIAWLMCQKGWLTMERYEKSLPQMLREHKQHKAHMAQYQTPPAESPQEPTPIEAQTVPAGPAQPVPRLDLNTGSVVAPDPRLIRANCSCGQQIEASSQYGGKIVRCPACREPVMMPESIAERHDAFIRFACPCGRRIKMPNRYAGRWGKCPRCGARIQIPSPAKTPREMEG